MIPENTRDADASQREEAPWRIRLYRWLWRVSAFLGTAVLLGLAINVVSTWFTNSNGSIPADSPFGFLLAHWLIVLPSSCCLLLIALLIKAASELPAHLPIKSSLVQQNRVHMLGRLRLTYRDLLAHSLQGAIWIELSLAEKPKAVRNATTLLLRATNQPDRLLPIGTSILDAYDQAERELLILGAPGAGKSTLLLVLAQQLVERAALDAKHPLPVILPLSSWVMKYSSLQDWIAEQLTQFYDVPRRTSELWVRENAILPLLDGLDEMDEAARPGCIAAINIYHQTHLGVPLVIGSRTAEYSSAAGHQELVLQRAVVVQPLTFQQADACLQQAGKPMAALRRALKTNRSLQELTTTPLMLSVLMLTYRGTLLRELPTRTSLLQQQMWTDYVLYMVGRRGDINRYPLGVTRTWLSWLAQGMRSHNQDILYLEHLQPDWLAPQDYSSYDSLAVRLPAILVGVCASIVVKVFFNINFDWVNSFHFVVLGGFLGELFHAISPSITTRLLG